MSIKSDDVLELAGLLSGTGEEVEGRFGWTEPKYWSNSHRLSDGTRRSSARLNDLPDELGGLQIQWFSQSSQEARSLRRHTTTCAHAGFNVRDTADNALEYRSNKVSGYYDYIHNLDMDTTLFPWIVSSVSEYYPNI